jgi:hypothetical protein
MRVNINIGRSGEMSKKKPKLGTGERFRTLSSSLKKQGVKNPDALAASIGRKKYGSKKMAAMSAKGRKRSKK